MNAIVAPRRFLAGTRKILSDYGLLLPAFILLGLVFLIPVCQLLWISFLGSGNEISLVNYDRLFHSPLYVRVLAGTFTIAAWTTVICLIAGYPVAYMLARATANWRNLLILLVLMPFWTSFLVRTFAWIVLLGRKGVINSALLSLGLTEEPLSFIYNFTGVMVGMSHALMPLAILTMYSVMQNIDPNYGKAAGTLGARGAHVFWRIYFPLSMPGVAAAGLLVFITGIGFFITSILLGGPKEIMIAQVIVIQVEEMLDWGFAGAVSVLLLVTCAVVFFFFDRLVGMSVLTGEARAGGTRRPGLLQRTGAVVGNRLVALIGWGCAYLGDAWDAVARKHRQPIQPRSSRGLAIVTLAVIAFLAVPSFFVVPISFSTSPFFEWPPQGFTLKWYQDFLASPLWQAATIRSFAVGIATAVLSVAIGTPAAFVLARRRVPGKTLVLGFFLLPIVLPHIIVAVALFYVYSQIGLVGTSIGLVLGHTIFSIPYVVVTVIAVLKNYDVRLDQAAWTLGASRWATFRHITFPLIRTGMLTAFLFAFVKSFDELTVALFVSGGLATTLPRQLWSDALLKASPTLAAVSTVLLVFVSVAIVASEYATRRSSR